MSLLFEKLGILHNQQKVAHEQMMLAQDKELYVLEIWKGIFKKVLKNLELETEKCLESRISWVEIDSNIQSYKRICSHGEMASRESWLEKRERREGLSVS